MHGSTAIEHPAHHSLSGPKPHILAAIAAVLFACAPATPPEAEEQPSEPVEQQAVEPTAETFEAADAAGDSMTLTGTIRYLDLEGGVYVIASDGTNYNPIDGLAQEFQVDGLEVEAEVRQRDDVAGVGMVGPMVEVLSIQRSEGADGEEEDDAEETAEPVGAAASPGEGVDETAGEASEADDNVIGETADAADSSTQTESTDPSEEAPAAEEAPVAGGDSELWDSAWRLVDLGGRRAMGQVEASLEFPAEGGRAVGNASCNRFFGGVAVDGDSITFLDVGTMRMSCPEAINDQEQRFLAALESAERYEVEDQELRIFGGDSEAPIRFSRIVEQQG